MKNVAPEVEYPWAALVQNLAPTVNGVLLPGEQTLVTLPVLPGARFSFALMFVESNDLFYAPDENGIALMGADGIVSGDLTDQVYLWDAGTELNEEPGLGPNQPMRQGEADTGPPDDDENVRMVDDECTYPAVSDVLNVSVSSTGRFFGIPFVEIRFANVSTDETLSLSDGTTKSVPFSEGPVVVHFDPAPIFTPGLPDRDMGLESLAEDGGIYRVVLPDCGKCGRKPLVCAWGMGYAHGACPDICS